MKKIRIISILIVMITFSACSNDSEEEILGRNDCKEEVLYTKTIKPLMKTNCAVKGCHVSGGEDPDLSSYDKVLDNLKEIEEQVTAKEMPPKDSGIKFSDEEMEALLCWIHQGGLNN